MFFSMTSSKYSTARGCRRYSATPYTQFGNTDRGAVHHEHSLIPHEDRRRGSKPMCVRPLQAQSGSARHIQAFAGPRAGAQAAW